MYLLQQLFDPRNTRGSPKGGGVGGCSSGGRSRGVNVIGGGGGGGGCAGSGGGGGGGVGGALDNTDCSTTSSNSPLSSASTWTNWPGSPQRNNHQHAVLNDPNNGLIFIVLIAVDGVIILLYLYYLFLL